MTLKHLRTIKKEAETSVFTVTYNDKSRNVSQNWVVPGDESVKVLQNKRQNDKHDKLCNMCGGNNHDAAKCRHRSSEYANLSEKPYVGSDGHAKLVAAKGASYTRISYSAQAATTTCNKWHARPRHQHGDFFSSCKSIGRRIAAFTLIHFIFSLPLKMKSL